MQKTLAYYLSLPYQAHLAFDHDYQVWIVWYPELPGCIADGRTQYEALQRGVSAKELWLETALEGGRMEISEPQSVSGEHETMSPQYRECIAHIAKIEQEYYASLFQENQRLKEQLGEEYRTVQRLCRELRQNIPSWTKLQYGKNFTAGWDAALRTVLELIAD